MKKIWLCLPLLASLSAAGAEPLLRHGRIYELGKASGDPLYTQDVKFEEVGEGQTKSASTIKDAKGDVLMTEIAVYKGDRIVSQKIDQFQTKEAYELELKGDEVIFHTFKIVDGEHQAFGKDKIEKMTPDFLTGPVAEPFLKNHWSEIMEGKKLKVSFGVFEIAKSVNFEFKKIKADEKTVVVQMKPANFFLSMFVDALELEFDAKEKVLKGFRGRSPLKKIINDKLKNFDAEIQY